MAEKDEMQKQSKEKQAGVHAKRFVATVICLF